MTPYFHHFTALAAAFCLLMLGSCSCEKEETTAIFVFADVTDSLNFGKLKENHMKDIRSALLPAFKQEECHGGLFRLYAINALGANEYSELEYGVIPTGKTVVQLEEDSVLVGFKSSVPLLFERLFETFSGAEERTKIYLPLCKALNELSSTAATRKVAVIYSDMLEHTERPGFSFYRDGAVKDHEQILKTIVDDCKCEISDLSEVEVHVVNHRRAGTDRLMEDCEHFWKWLFEDHLTASKVRMGANLKL